MNNDFPTSITLAQGFARARLWLTIGLCLTSSFAQAQTVPERPRPAVINQNAKHRVAEPSHTSMSEAVALVHKDPSKYQVHVYDLIKGDVYCDIQSIVVDGATGWVQIHFNYRGRTSISLKPASVGSVVAFGSYTLSLPLIGSTEVKVNLTFSQDGTARGKWKNMGYDGAFNIVKR